MFLKQSLLLIFRSCVDVHHIQILGEVLSRCSTSFQTKQTVSVVECITECFRALRNACAAGPPIQSLLADHERCIECSKSILDTVTRQGISQSTNISENVLVMLRCCVQFLGNFVTNHRYNSRLVWGQFLDYFRYYSVSFQFFN